MDWLPSKPAANAAAVAAALIKSKEKKPRRSSAASKKAQKAALKGKENNQVEIPEDADGHTTAASNGSSDPEKGSKLEWRFLALATHPPCQVEEGKVVKNTPPDHYYDVPESARNLIQIWAVPVQRPKILTDKRGATEKRLVKPRLVFAIDHESGVAWDLQWCPLVKKFPKTPCRENILGILAACFGDGSMRVFEIPAVPEERLQMELDKEQHLVDKNIPIVVARLPRIMQLSVQWSPHTWNVLLTGGSDGSVSLWNIKSAVSESDSLGDERIEPEPIEPQRRFQDADTIGKQEAFDWAVAGSQSVPLPGLRLMSIYSQRLEMSYFLCMSSTRIKDSVFKVWDVREPRVCLRSHRIRSTWGLALQWMDQTSIQISGDQGSSGSYQKLHFHPQIDSPVWDLQFARRGANCVEICRLSGQKDSSIEQPFKSLRVSFDKHSVLGSADTKANPHANATKKSFIQEDGEVEVDESVEEEEEPEFEDEDEEEDESDLSLVMGDSSDDDRISVSDNAVEEEEATAIENPEEARLMKEYQLDLSEEDAILLAIQMSVEDKQPAPANAAVSESKKPAKTSSDSGAKAGATAKKRKKTATSRSGQRSSNGQSDAISDECQQLRSRSKTGNRNLQHRKARAPAKRRKTRGGQSSNDQDDVMSEKDAVLLAIRMSKETIEEKQPVSANAEVVGTSDSTKPAKTPSNIGAEAASKERKKTATTPGGRSSNAQGDIVSEDIAPLGGQTSEKLVEENQPASAAKKGRKSGATPDGGQQSINGQGDNVTDDALAMQMSKELVEEKQPAPAVPETSDSTKPATNPTDTGANAEPASKKRKKTAAAPGGRRSSNAQGGITSDVAPAAQMSEETVEEKQPASNAAVAAIPESIKPARAKAGAAAMKRKRTATIPRGQQGTNGQGGTTSDEAQAIQLSKELVEEKQPACASAAIPAASESKKPAKRSSNTKAKAGAATKRKKTATTPRGRRRNHNSQGDIMSEEDALRLALAISELEY
ncbi:WD40 repeat, conserved site [Phytophthora cactorum]|nr:WD40 repeat, conserved site [Phytophthora cactorum]